MMKTDKKALILLTSHSELGTTGRETGFYYDEMAAPYWALIDAGFDVDIVSVKGGEAPARPEAPGAVAVGSGCGVCSAGGCR